MDAERFVRAHFQELRLGTRSIAETRRMHGFIVRHRLFGMGKLHETSGAALSVTFFEAGNTQLFDKDAIEEGDLSRVRLPIGSRCRATRGDCVIEESIGKPNRSRSMIYRVTFEDGLRAEIDESELWPIEGSLPEDPLELLSGLNSGSYRLFQGREVLMNSLSRWRRAGGGLRALLSSRIDVRAHQAYVSGMVLLDGRRRYLLADEVGLGKTIEAGLIIHDLLSRKPDARILILCPAALTQQWFCELYSKFCGYTFTLPELRPDGAISWDQVKHVIVGLTDAMCFHSAGILASQWDMVIVDETHHLATSSQLYDFVFMLARKTTSLLLLSAMPAQRRKDELLQLLVLLEPDRFHRDQTRNGEWFQQLFDRQTDIGRKLSLLRRRVDGLATGDFTLLEAREKAGELLTLPLIADDPDLSTRLVQIPQDLAAAAEHFRRLMHDVAERYRINRRILRNRRQHLIEQEQMSAITRVFAPRPYEPDQLELDVASAAQQMLCDARSAGLSEDYLLAFARVIWQSISVPGGAFAVAEQLIQAKAGNPNARGRDFIVLSHLSGYASWTTYLQLLCCAVRRSIPNDAIGRFHRSAKSWVNSRGDCERLQSLIALLREKSRGMSSGTKPKMLVFAGFPGAARWLTNELQRSLGVQHVTEFREEIERQEKEANVKRFRTNADTWVMVSDESGGEGRNFQFASEIIHFDTPWYIHRIEQRIGRLDRLGRENQLISDVTSNVLIPKGAVEEGLVRCFARGFRVYEQSISGLEFALREAERSLVLVGIDDGLDGLLRQDENIKTLADDERARDESEGVLDEASFDRSAAQAFRRVRDSPQTELELEEAFCKYVSIVSSNGAVGIHADEEYSSGLYRFRTDRFLHVRPANIAGAGKDLCVGTFRRDIAQQRLDVQFLTVGNPFFDSVTATLATQPCGRTYAINVSDRTHAAWAGFEFAFIAEPQTAMSHGNLGFFNRMEQLFSVDPVHVFVSADGSLSDQARLLQLRTSIRFEDKDKTWQNFTKDKTQILRQVYGGDAWLSMVKAGIEAARASARSRFEERLSEGLLSEERRLNELLSRIEREGALEEAEVLRQWIAALRGWQPRLDSCGYLSVNNAYSAGVRQ